MLVLMLIVLLLLILQLDAGNVVHCVVVVVIIFVKAQLLHPSPRLTLSSNHNTHPLSDFSPKKYWQKTFFIISDVRLYRIFDKNALRMTSFGIYKNTYKNVYVDSTVGYV